MPIAMERYLVIGAPLVMVRLPRLQDWTMPYLPEKRAQCITGFGPFSSRRQPSSVRVPNGLSFPAALTACLR